MKKLNRYVLLLVTVLISLVVNSQELKKNQADWQQAVNYTIQVQLDDNDHFLRGNLNIEYVNNSPDELTYIMMHLWPNAYKNNKTAFAQQMLGNGDANFYFAKEEDKGWIDSLNFNVDGTKVEWKLDSKHIDIARIELKEPVKPGDTILIHTPFKVKIPGSFSRFGHVKNGYQITQWYPKPAVYDVNGWNAMPYLDQGEFYSEFGSFKVEITLPSDYVVSATGELQEEAEWDFLTKREKKPMSAARQEEKREDFTSSEMKTITYKQDRVHDFAWFADPTFNVASDIVQMPSGDSVKIMVFMTEEHDESKSAKYVTYTKNALMYYSQYIGNYPYKYCSVVQGALLAGGGMEYPMVTVIPNLGEEVIVHEVGHNWFFGILGSNERTYPWMDESINSYYENRTILNYANKAVAKRDPLGKITIGQVMTDPDGLLMDILYNDIERQWEHQPIGAPSEIYTSSNYGLMIYGKGTKAFAYLEAYLGRQILDKGFQSYFEKWKFKHPLPGDLKAELEAASGKDLTWFFDQYLESDGIMDYSIEFVNKVTGKATISNKGDIVAPFPMDYILGDKIVRTIWIDGFEGTKDVDLLNVEYSAIKIDANRLLTETYTRNNTYRLDASSPTFEQVKRDRLFSIEDPNRTQFTLNLAPGWNAYDQFMIGLFVTNIRVPRQKLEYIFTPMYGFGSKEVVGYGGLRYTSYYKNSRLSSSQIGLSASRFSHEMPGIYNDSFTYTRLAPFVKWDFARPSKRSRLYRSLMLRTTLIGFNPFVSDDDKLKRIELTDSSRRSSFVNPNARTFIDLVYETRNKRALNPYSFKIKLQTGIVSDGTFWLDSSKTTGENVFTKLEFTGKYRVTYPNVDHGLDIRVFVGSFITKATASAFQFPVTNTNTDVVHPDYTYEYAQMGRGSQSDAFVNQLIEGGAFLKNARMVQTADQWIAAVNLKAEVPIPYHIGVYMDLFTSNNITVISGDDQVKFGYSGGMFYDVIPDFMSIYFPLFASQFITDAQDFHSAGKFGQKIVFTMNLNLFNPFEFRETLKDIF